MIEFAGTWSDGLSTRQREATLRLDNRGHYRLLVDGEEHRGQASEFEISARLGNTPRQLRFPDGRQFETEDNAAVDQLVAQLKGDRGGGWVHRLESHWGTVLGFTAGTVVFVWLFLTVGVPWLSREIAFAMPPDLLADGDARALEILDRMHFEPSQLPVERREELRETLLSSTPELEPPVRIIFRHGGELGANAFALPGGSIVFTDEIIELAESTGQLQAVYGHELGHLAGRHSLRRITQNSLVSIAAVLITGDSSVTTDLVAAIPFALTDLAWSRDFETEADDYALHYLAERNIPASNFPGLMIRLECSQRSRAEEDYAAAFQQCLDQREWDEEDTEWSYYLFSHPPTEERIARFKD